MDHFKSFSLLDTWREEPSSVASDVQSTGVALTECFA
jgi:hypothetical protein